MSEAMTVQQVLEISINNLNAIPVPISMSQQISEPILGIINNLRLCIDALNKPAEKEPEEPEEAEGTGGEEDGSVPDAE